MFNPMSTEQLTAALGTVLDTAAAAEDPLSEDLRGQLRSAARVARALAAEQAHAAQLMAWFRDRLAELVDDVPAQIDATELGALLVALLDELGDGLTEREFRRRLHRLFAELCDREVAALGRS